MADTDYETFKQMPIEDLARRAAGSGTGSSLEMAKFVYGERMLEQQYEYTKQQIELQHIKNTELVNKQVRWITFSAIITAIATLSAVVLGWCLSELKSLQRLKSDMPQIVQSQTKTSTSLPYYERKDGKVP
jgi:sterol desaturase/sphingolipid hydroxylase (fatty acid hydroxylase superfamily)